jgi:hypothetical protein
MDCELFAQHGRTKSPCPLICVFFLLVLVLTPSVFGQLNPELGLEITVPDAMTPKILLGGRQGYGGTTLIRRNSLTITNANAAAGFTAIDVQALPEGNAIRVTLSIIYNDINVQEWWKDKNQKAGGSYLIRAGEMVLASGLVEFGIEPFEMKVVNTAPIVFKPGEGPRIVNNTTALKIERLEKHLNSYSIQLKNVSDKDIIVYSIVSGNSGMTSSSIGMTDPAIAAGETSRGAYLSTSDVEQRGVTIPLAIFSDSTFEGDAKQAIKFLAKSEGVKAQTPYVLRMIEQTLKVDDSDIRFAFEKLEADLWVIPEALFKPEALQFLKVKYPDQDDKALLALYEDFKGGLYDARNIALSSIGQTQRGVKEYIERGQYADATDSIGHCLNSIRETLAKIIFAPR